MNPFMRILSAICLCAGLLVVGLPTAWAPAQASPLTSSSGRATWQAGWKYYTPVIFLNKAETHTISGIPGVVTPLQSILPPPFSMLFRLEAAAIAINARQAEARNMCIFIGPHGASNWYSGGYCR